MPTTSVRDALRKALDEEMSGDPCVIFLGQDIGTYGGAFGVSRGLLEKYGDKRVIETPISENSVVGVAVGASMLGYKAVVEFMFQDFVTLAMDQIVNHAAKIAYIYNGQLTVPITIRLVSGGGRGYGASHSQTLDSWFTHVPGLKVVAPCTPGDAYGLLRAAIQDPDPVIFIENKLVYDVKGEVDWDGRSSLRGGRVVREGSDVTVLAYGRMLHLALKAAAGVESEGLDVEVVDLRVLKPLDRKLITASVKKTGRAVIVDEGCRTGGVGAESAAVIVEECLHYLDGPVIRVAGADSPIPAAAHLERMILPDAAQIADAIRRSVG